eukprot:COSAG04_NODE_1784_length_5588_cov_2.790854_3_plen_139_part_00
MMAINVFKGLRSLTIIGILCCVPGSPPVNVDAFIEDNCETSLISFRAMPTYIVADENHLTHCEGGTTNDINLRDTGRVCEVTPKFFDARTTAASQANNGGGGNHVTSIAHNNHAQSRGQLAMMINFDFNYLGQVPNPE